MLRQSAGSLRMYPGHVGTCKWRGGKSSLGCFLLQNQNHGQCLTTRLLWCVLGKPHRWSFLPLISVLCIDTHDTFLIKYVYFLYYIHIIIYILLYHCLFIYYFSCMHSFSNTILVNSLVKMYWTTKLKVTAWNDSLYCIEAGQFIVVVVVAQSVQPQYLYCVGVATSGSCHTATLHLT